MVPAQAEVLEITSIEVSPAGAYENISIKTTGWITPKHSYFEDPYRLLLTFSNTKVSSPITIKNLKGSRIKSIRAEHSSADPSTCEVLVVFGENIKYDVANIMGRNMTIIEFTGSQGYTVAKEEKREEGKAEASVSKGTTELPDLKKAGKFDIILNGGDFRAGGSPLFSNGVFMVPARHFFEALDSQVFFTKEGKLSVRRGDQKKIEFYINSKVAKVNGADFELETAPILIQKFTRKIAYVPLISVASIIDYGVVWRDKDKILIINPRLAEVLFSGKDPSYKLDLTFTDSIRREKFGISSIGNLITVEVKDVIKAERLGDVKSIGDGGIEKIYFKQENDRVLVATVVLKSQKPYRASFSERGDMFSILFSTAIFKLKPVKGDGWAKIEVYPNGPITFEVSSAKNPERIILDFPDTILTAPSQIKISDDIISGAKVSQFSFDPPTTRMVISLSERADFRTYLSADSLKASVIVRWPKRVAKKTWAKKYAVLRDKVIVIDPAHGGIDPGGTGYSGTYEKYATLSLALKIAEVLEEAGATVLLTREKDAKIRRADIVRFANNNKADIFMSLHYNSFKSKYMSGTETYYYTPQSRLFARVIHRNLVRGIKRRNRGIKRVMYYTIHHTTMPAILVEPGYITNPTEEKLAFSPSFQKEVAYDILKGVVEYFNIVSK